MPHGLLNLNKRPGLTSRQAVNRVQRLARPAKVGHAGTLDPLAGGVLVVCVGSATRLIEYVQKMPKSYAATFLLGRESPTEDVDGDVVALVAPPVPTLDELARAASSLTGTIQQRPPAFSALKVAGRRAYDMARAGRPVELAPRPVTVYRIAIVGYEYPELKLEIDCGSGTYVRSLGRDLACSLGTAAVMSALVRTAIGVFRVEEAIEPDSLTEDNWCSHLRPPLDAVASLPRRQLSDAEVERVQAGQFVADSIDSRPPGEEVAAVDSAGRLVAILTGRGAGQLGPARNLHLDD